jgi:hypothetical protein
MKKLLFSLMSFLVACMLGIEQQAFAYGHGKDGFQSYLGFDAQHIWVKGDSEWNNVFQSMHPGANIYLGVRLSNFIGLELGYSWTTRKTKNYGVAAGETAFGITNSAATTISTQVRLKNTHFDINAYFPMGKYMEVITSLGIGASRQGMIITSSTTSNLGNALVQVRGKTTPVGRLGLGLEGMVTDTTGIRAMWRYDTLSRVKVRSAPTGVSDKVFKNSSTILLGLIWKL